jgi:putative ATPase
MNTTSSKAAHTAMPLAAQLRPQDLDHFYGQQHLLAKGKPLRQAIEQGILHSMILWGPPGTGKTTLAHIIAKHCQAEIICLSAVLSGVKDIRATVDKANFYRDQGKATMVFVDEVHRFNKSQQDAFLPHVESGLLTIIGATTENPSFEVNNALLSRTRVYTLKALQNDDLLDIMGQALAHQAQSGKPALDFPTELRAQLAQCADGDARRMLNLLEILAETANNNTVTQTNLQDALATGTRRFDKGGDEFYHQISALHKSVRGSSPDGALYWFARMIDAGCDPLYIARRVIRMASEDIGNADPRALALALNARDTQQCLGSPEGELAIAQAIAYLAAAPKSNAVYTAYKQALQAAKEHGSLEVPMHLRNAPTKLMKNMGYGKTYRYAHDEPGQYASGEHYFPDKLPEMKFYRPKNSGLEIKIKAKLDHLKQLDKEASS